MKPQSFEYQLRHAVPPAPDTEAQQRARQAALAEFARIHGAQNEAPAATTPASHAQPAREKHLRWPWIRSSRDAWLGGFATACLLLVGVSIVWLLPPRDREIKLNVPMSRQESAPSPDRAPPEVRQPSTTTPPAEDTRKSPARSRKAEERGAVVIEPRHEQRQQQAPRVSLAEATQPAPTAEAEAQDTSGAASGTTTTFAPSEGSGGAEITVTGSRIVRSADTMIAPTPITDVTDQPVPASPARRARAATAGSAGTASSDEDHSLEEVAVTGARRSRLRDFFSRRSSASEAPPAPPPPPSAPAVQRDEGRDKFQHFETNPVKRVADDPVSTFSVDVDTAAYSFVRRKLNEGVLPQVDSVRVEEMINYFDYHWPVSESRDQPFKPTVTVSDSPWGEGKKLIHIGIKGYALPATQQPDVNLVLLLDVSGSMDSPDKLPLAQRSMALLLDALKPTDTVAIVVYAGAAGQVLAPTPVSDKQTILQALYSLRPGGSTAGAQGIELAYRLAEKSFRKGGVNRILLATDGDFNVGITNENELKGFVEREREKGVYLSVLGFGEGNYRDQMAQTLAQNGNGVAAYIDTPSEAQKVLVQEATSALFPIAKDVKLQVEFNPATVAEYRLVGYETRALNREDFNNDKVDAGDVGSGHTVTAIYEITPVGSQGRLIDERRYRDREEKADAQRKPNEYGFLKIRYKLPGGFRSRLIEQPILLDAGVPAALKDDVQFSTAVAGFAQLLRGSTYTGKLSYEDVLTQAQHAVGADPFGYRSEFVQLVSKAHRAAR
jgi:Ca-activated chloride channel homolog